MTDVPAKTVLTPAEKRARQLAHLKPFPKGKSGNPAGRPKNHKDIVQLARDNAEKAMKRAVALIDHEDPRIACRAIDTVLDRAFGKPAQAITGEGGEGPVVIAHNLIMSAAHDLRSKLDRFLERSADPQPQGLPN